MDLAIHRLELGNKFPFDASDEWQSEMGPPPPPLDWAHSAARGVIADLTDRLGIKNGFNGIDEDVRVEIIESLAEIIRQAEEHRSETGMNSEKKQPEKEWIECIGKTIAGVEVVNSGEHEDMELALKFTDGTVLTVYSAGWSEGVSADGSEICALFEKDRNGKVN